MFYYKAGLEKPVEMKSTNIVFTCQLGHAIEVGRRSSSATLEQVDVVVKRLQLRHAVEERSSSATLEQVDKTKKEDNETSKESMEQVDETQDKTEEEVAGTMGLNKDNLSFKSGKCEGNYGN